MEDSRLGFPSAPPEKVRAAIETLFSEWQNIQSERAQWNLERSQMRARIIQLEGEVRNHEKIRMDLVRRVKLLEHSLISERTMYVGGGSRQPPSSIAAAAQHKSGQFVTGPLADGRKRFYRTLPARLITPGSALVSGRQLLRDYLIELGYLKEAELLEDRSRNAAFESKVDGDAVKKGGSSGTVLSRRDASDEDSTTTGKSFAKPVKAANTPARRVSVNVGGVMSKPEDQRKVWKSLVTLRSHMDGVRTVSFHASEPVLLTSSEDGTAKLWNISDDVALPPKKRTQPLEPFHTFRGHQGMVTSAVIADGLKSCFTAGVDSKIFAWELPPLLLDPYDEAGRCMKYRKYVLNGHKDAVWSLCVHPLSTAMPLLFSASADGSVATWKVDQDKEGQLLRQVADGKEIPTALAVMNSDMKKLLVGYRSGQVAQLDIETGKIITRAKSKVDNVADDPHITDLCSHRTLPLAITSHADKNWRVFDVTQGACVSVTNAHRDVVTSVSMDSSGLFLASTSHDQSLRVWDFSSKKIVQDLDGYQTHRSKYDEAIHCVRYHASLPLLATGGADSIAKIYH